MASFLEELANDEDRPALWWRLSRIFPIPGTVRVPWWVRVHMDQEGSSGPEDPAEEPTEPEIDVIEVREVEEIPDLFDSLTPAAGVAAETTVVATPFPRRPA